MGLFISETYVDATANCIIGDSGIYETYHDSPGDLFRDCQREYGGCVSSMYIDEDGKTKRIGWVFSRREKFEDCDETFLREVWVSLHEREPETVTTKFYREI